MHQNPRPGFQRWQQSPHDLDAILTRPIMEDEAEVIEVRFHWLRVKKS